ncbi:MAG: hypothetical protein PHG00_18220, partial [Methylococcales bacterium]|nr:hypothetical protein [Methylococcales bacterium]
LNKNYWPHSIYQIADLRGKKNKRIAIDGVGFLPVSSKTLWLKRKSCFSARRKGAIFIAPDGADRFR